MPFLYRGTCSACGYESPTISDGSYGGVIVNDPTTADPYDLHSDDKRIVVLAHPLEFDILQKYGLTYLSATLQGRLIRFRDSFCKSCGHVYETRNLDAAPLALGCIPAIVSAILVGVVLGFTTSSIFGGVISAVIAAPLSLLIVDWILGLYVRFRYAERANEFRVERGCPRCGSKRVASRGTLPCPQCRRPTMKVDLWGMS